jgi:hypothetical protein
MVDAKQQKEVNGIITESILKGGHFGEAGKLVEIDPGSKALDTDFTHESKTASQKGVESGAHSVSGAGASKPDTLGKESEPKGEDNDYSYGMSQ